MAPEVEKYHISLSKTGVVTLHKDHVDESLEDRLMSFYKLKKHAFGIGNAKKRFDEWFREKNFPIFSSRQMSCLRELAPLFG